MKILIKLFFLLAIFSFLSNINIKTAYSVEYSIPNNGSPYVEIGSLKEGQILHVPTGIIVTPEQMIDNVSASRVIYVAETHDNIESHKVQLEIIKALQSQFPGEIVIGMEMFRHPAQEEINRWLNGKLNQTEFYHLWLKNWGEGYENYREILEFIKDNAIPLLALKPSRKIEQAFRSKGINGLSDAEKELIPEMDENDRYHKIFADAIFGVHGKNTHTTLKNPYNTLLLWEESMAETVTNYLKSPQGEKKKMIVLTGSFHVEYGFGIPKRAYRRMPHNYSVVLPTAAFIPEDIAEGRLMMDIEPTPIPLYLGDYVWNVKYRVLEKKETTLGVSLKTEEHGLLVVSVKEKSNAMTAGILPGDIIIEMDNHPVKTVDNLKALLHIKKTGAHGTIKLIRKQKEIIIDVEFKKY